MHSTTGEIPHTHRSPLTITTLACIVAVILYYTFNLYVRAQRMRVGVEDAASASKLARPLLAPTSSTDEPVSPEQERRHTRQSFPQALGASMQRALVLLFPKL